jgi:hypothetical protein
MLGDIVKEAVAGQPDMEIVAELSSAELPWAARDVAADVVMVGRELDEGSGPDLELLCHCHRIGVLALSTDGRRVFRYRFRTDREELSTDRDGLSLEHLLEAIRDVAARGTR